MTDKNMADVADRAVDKLSAIADAIGRIAPGTWESAVNSERAEGITWIVLIALGWAAFVPCLIRFVAEWRKQERYGNRERGEQVEEGSVVVMGTYGVLGAVIGLFAFIVTCSELPDAVSRVVGPEYWAAHSILRAVQ